MLGIFGLFKAYKNIALIISLVILVSGGYGIRSCNKARNLRLLEKEVHSQQEEKVEEGQLEVQDNVDYLEAVEEKNKKIVEEYKEKKQIKADSEEAYREKVIKDIQKKIDKDPEYQRLKQKALDKHLRKNKEVLE